VQRGREGGEVFMGFKVFVCMCRENGGI